jgi:hypothetical protein
MSNVVEQGHNGRAKDNSRTIIGLFLPGRSKQICNQEYNTDRSQNS